MVNDSKQKSARSGAFLFEMERSLVQNECDLQLHAVFGNIAILVDEYILIRNPGRLDVPERFHRPRNTLPDGIIETLGG
jgi:hypothetical protein